jgi:hypothetical protein
MTSMVQYAHLWSSTVNIAKFIPVVSYDQLWSSKTNMTGMAKYGHDMIKSGSVLLSSDLLRSSMTNYV